MLKRRPGFTLTEVLSVVAILTVLAVLAVPFARGSLTRNKLRTRTLEMVDTLRRAQAQAMAGQQDSVWGVHFESDKFALFRTSTYSASDADTEITNLEGALTITTISLNGGGSNVVFNKFKGDTSNFGSVVLRDNNTNETRTITVNAAGMIDFN